MLLALWPLLMMRTVARDTQHVEHLQKQSQRNIARTRAKLDEQAHLARLQAEDINERPSNRDTSKPMDLGSVPGGIEPVGNVAVRIPRHERPISGTIPAALGASIAASHVVSPGLDDAMRQLAAKQAQDDEDAMIIIAMLEM